MSALKTGIGIDVGGTKVWAVLGAEDGQVLSEYKSDTCRDPASFLQQLDDLIEYLVQDAGTSSLTGLGLGLPGRVSSRTGVIEWVPNLPHLNGLRVRDHIARRWGLRASLRNDAQLALLGEQWVGAAKGRSHVLLLTLGTGIGGAVMIHGRIWEGAHGTAGSMGWMTLDLHDQGHPELGWLERMASGTAMNQRGQQLSTPRNSTEVFDTAEQGDPEAAQLIQQIAHTIGTGIANAASLLEPEMVLISGGVSERLPLLLPAIRNALQRFGSPSIRHLPILPAQLSSRSGVLGALRLSFLGE